MAAGPVAAALLLTTSAAFAGALSYTGFTVTGDSVTVDTPVTATGVAGLIHLITPGGTVVNAWCIDVYDPLLGSGTYSITPVTVPLPGVPTLSDTQIGEIGALMVHGDQLVGAPPPGDTADDVATAIQVDIWSVEYGAGVFTYNYVDPTVATLAPLYYLDSTGGAWAPFTQYAALNGSGQNLSTDQTLAAVVPELPTWEMMLLGFAGLGFAGLKGVKGGLSRSPACTRIACGGEG